MSMTKFARHAVRSAILTVVVLTIAIAVHLAFGNAILWRPVSVVATACFVGLLLLEVLGDLFEPLHKRSDEARISGARLPKINHMQFAARAQDAKDFLRRALFVLAGQVVPHQAGERPVE